MPIEIRNVRFGYRESDPVLKDMNFTCHDNRVTGIIGPNGCGKTTILKVIAGFFSPESGSIHYNGRSVSDLGSADLAKLRAVVEQRVYTPFSFPVYDYVMLGRTPYQGNFSADTEEDHSIVTNALKDANILEFQSRKINELSGGELQRVMIARALAQQPDYLLLDEPTSHLDIRQQLELMKLLGGIAKEKSVLCIIHEINQASAYCDDVVLTKGGYVLKEGKTNEVLSAGILEDVFGVLAMQFRHPEGNRNQFVFSLPPEKKTENPLRVHVISGEGMGRKIIMSLHSAGFDVSAGILNEGDQDYETCRYADIDMISAPAFSGYSDAEVVKLKKYCDEADVIVLVATNAGSGNLPNLETAYQYLEKKEFFFVNPDSDFKKADWTDGRATEIYNEINKKAKVVSDAGELLSELL